MLPKKNRLPARLIPALLKKGDRLNAADFKLIWLKNKEGKGKKKELPTQFAFLVPKKIVKQAVLRNKIKRWFREATRSCLKRTRSGFQIIILAKKNIRKNSFKKLALEIQKSLIKIGALKK